MDKEQVLQSQTVIIRDGKIAEIGSVSKVRVPKDAVKIDGRGKYLMPGLVDMHVHMFPDDKIWFLYLANGVTTVRIMNAAQEVGTVAVNKRADLFLLEHNPLIDIATLKQPAGVMTHGNWFPKNELEKRLAEIAAYYETN